MSDFEQVWQRIKKHAGEPFHTITGLPFTYVVPGDYVRVTRDGREISRSLSKTNFRRASAAMPTAGPAGLSDRQGSAYTWAMLADPRIRE